MGYIAILNDLSSKPTSILYDQDKSQEITIFINSVKSENQSSNAVSEEILNDLMNWVIF